MGNRHQLRLAGGRSSILVPAIANPAVGRALRINLEVSMRSLIRGTKYGITTALVFIAGVGLYGCVADVVGPAAQPQHQIIETEEGTEDVQDSGGQVCKRVEGQWICITPSGAGA